MKRKFLEILFFISELGGKTSLERLKALSWRGEISTILQSFGRKSPFYEAYEENFHCGALNTKFILRILGGYTFFT
jgi:hypothetical protein